MFRVVLIVISLLSFQALLFAASPALKPETPEYTAARAKMVLNLKTKGIKDEAVLNAMGHVQRQEFSPEKFRAKMYDDISIPLGSNSTVAQPYMVALMTEALRLKPDSKVLEIGTSTGYNAAVMAEMAGEVYTIEILPELAKQAEDIFKRLGYTNVHVKAGDGFFGWPEAAPFDAILITCSSDKVPPKLVEQLKEGGRIVMPLGETYSIQTLASITKVNGKLVSRPIAGVQIFPMLGEIKN